MKQLVGKAKNHFTTIYYSLLVTIMSFQSQVAYAQGGDIQARIDSALTTIQGVLTGLIVTVGIVVALFIIIKRMPSADDPREKSEVYKAVGRVLGLVAIGAAIVWVVPWVYNLFQ